MRHAIILLIVLAAPVLTSAATLKVPSQYPTIQDAIDAAIKGDTVLVEPGTYVEKIDFKGKAITVTSEQGADVTVIDGNKAWSVVICQSGEDENSKLDGFTITNGGSQYLLGGGMYIDHSSPTVTNCTFIGNVAWMGGGLYNEFSNPTVANCSFIKNYDWLSGGGMCNCDSSPSVIGCTFFENSATNYGGGMCNLNSSPAVIGCSFFGNSTDCGGGMHNYYSNPRISTCSFSKNSAHTVGGGLHNDNSSPTVTNCIINENVAHQGGGMMNFPYSNPKVINCTFNLNSGEICGGGMSNSFSHPTLTNCTFSGNSAHGYYVPGGGMYNEHSHPAITNCIFFKNTADISGGMSNHYSSNPMVINCTFYGNSAKYVGGAMGKFSSSPTMTNCIFWNDAPDEIYDNGGYHIVTYSCIQGGYPGKGNIDADPLFVDPANGDFHLTFQSPCKDTGDDLSVNEPYDFEGDPRIAHGTVDMGADEFYTHLYWTGDDTPGGKVEVKFVGLPGTSPVGLCIGTGVLDPPLKSMWGDWYLAFPIIGPIDLGKIPSPDGLLVIPGIIPGSPPPPYSIPMQALIGAELTNMAVLEVK